MTPGDAVAARKAWEAAEMRKRRAAGKCTARIWHGPGHQTSTWCDRTGEHRVHHAIYGRYDTEGEWTGKVGFDHQVAW